MEKTKQNEVWVVLTFGVEDFVSVEDQTNGAFWSKEDALAWVRTLVFELAADDPNGGWHHTEDDQGDDVWFSLFNEHRTDDPAFGYLVRKLTVS